MTEADRVILSNCCIRFLCKERWVAVNSPLTTFYARRLLCNKLMFISADKVEA